MAEEQTQKREKKQAGSALLWIGGAIVFVAVTATVLISWVLYEHTVNLLTANLRERLIAIVKTASVQISSDDLDALQEFEDYKSDEYRRVVTNMLKMRENNEDIVFMYILRKHSEDPTKMVFAVDSHSLDPFAKIDLDGDGVITDADALNWPGQEYEDVPEEAFDAYSGPTTNKELYEDQWGILISGYDPIYREDGSVAGIMSVDVRADDFFRITRQTLYPFLAFIVVLVSLLLVLATALIKIWNKRVALFAELDRQKDELLSIVSHQLATPITSLKWYLEMLIDGDAGELTQSQKQHVASMQPIATDLADLVSMILDVSRIQLGRMKVDRAALSLGEFFAEVLTVIEPKTQEKKVQFHTSIPENLPTAMLDKRLMRMTLENLLSNAVKYTPEGGTVKFAVQIQGNQLSYQVRDTGCGIPKSEQGKVFSKLFRASNVRNVDGNGFGLYVAKGAVASQSGKIWFESEEGKGTTFFVEMPIEGAGHQSFRTQVAVTSSS